MDDEAEIVRRVLAGDIDAYEILVTRHQALVFGIAHKQAPAAEAAALAQEVFVQAFQSLASYAGRAPFAHWLAGIAVRRCRDYWRARGRRRERTAGEWGGADPQAWMEAVLAAPSREAFERETARAAAAEILEQTLACLTADDRLVVSLVYLEGRSMAEAAALLGWSQTRVKVRAHRARRRLRHRIERLALSGDQSNR